MPTAPSVVKVTVLFAGVVEKFVPEIVIVGAFCASGAELVVMVGAGTMAAT